MLEIHDSSAYLSYDAERNINLSIVQFATKMFYSWERNQLFQ
jgi:hypothetical protein